MTQITWILYVQFPVFSLGSPTTYTHRTHTDDNEDDDEDDLDYNGSSSSGSDSIVIKIASKDGNSSKLPENVDTNKPITEQSIATTATAAQSATAETNIGTVNASASTATSNYNYNNENYYSKDDISVYDDVNNNRLNLRSNPPNGRSNAYEQRNIYVANNVLSDTTNDSVKSYIHIEVYKGNLDGTVTAKPKDMKSMNAFGSGKSMSAKSVVQLHPNESDGTAEISSTKP